MPNRRTFLKITGATLGAAPLMPMWFQPAAPRIPQIACQQYTWYSFFKREDYPRLADMLLERNIRPHFVLEQAAEDGTPHTMNAIESGKRSLAYAEELFAAYAE